MGTEPVLQYALKSSEGGDGFFDTVLYVNYLYPFRPEGFFDDMIDECQQVLTDQWVPDDTHQVAALPPSTRARRAKCTRASEVKLSVAPTGSQASSGKARRRWTSASNREKPAAPGRHGIRAENL